MQIQSISERFLYLTMESKIRMLDLKEHEDLKHCSEILLKKHISHEWDSGKIMNLMRTAFNNSDWDWLDELGKELELFREASSNNP